MILLPHQKSTYPTNPGVYRMRNVLGDIVYIGKAKVLRNRLANYFDSSKRSPRIDLMIKEIHDIEVTVTETENDALMLEQRLITTLKPRYNIIFRDDKSYPFIAMSKHRFPKVYITREKNTDQRKENLFGPYPQKEDAYRNAEFIQNIFKLRTCKDNDFQHRSRPCVLHSIGKCSAPCVKRDDPEFVKQYDDQVDYAKQMLGGNIRPVLADLEARMQSASDDLRFEEAARLRDTMASLKDLRRHQTIFSLTETEGLVFTYYGERPLYLGYTKIVGGTPQKISHIRIDGELENYSLEELLTRYIESERHDDLPIVTDVELKDLFYDYQHKSLNKQQRHWLSLVRNNLQLIAEDEHRRTAHQERTVAALQEVFLQPVNSVDCIDISHFSGEATYGGKVRWSHNNVVGDLEKPHYRLAKFSDKEVDDVRHIGETVGKIYTDDEHKPDVLVVDGGRDQLEAAYKNLPNKHSKDILLLGSAKGVSRKKGAETIFVHSDSLKLVRPEFLKHETLMLPTQHPVRLLIQNLQDAAHDFANGARTKAMSKTRFDSGVKKKLSNRVSKN